MRLFGNLSGRGLWVMFVVLVYVPTAQGFFAGFGSYVKNYNVGISAIGTNNSLDVTYKLDSLEEDKNCQVESGAPHQLCRVRLQESGKGLGAGYLHGFGIFFQQPFKRQGFWHFNYDLGIDFLAFAGDYRPSAHDDGGQLRQIEYRLYGGRFKPHIEFGVTPRSLFPDILISLGPVVQLMAGEVSINEQTETVGLMQRSSIFSGLNPLGYAYFQLQLVLIRFGDGAFSFYSSRSVGSSGQTMGNFYSGSVDGMRDFQASFFSSSESGFKLLLNWPS